MESESLIFRSNEYWAEHNVELVKGEYIARIDKEADGSGVAHASSGREFPFKRLALTVGARARKLDIEAGTWTACCTCAMPTTRSRSRPG